MAARQRRRPAWGKLEDPSKVSYVVIASTAVGFAVAMVLAGRWSARRARMHDA
jgi:hypothetical protein